MEAIIMKNLMFSWICILSCFTFANSVTHVREANGEAPPPRAHWKDSKAHDRIEFSPDAIGQADEPGIGSMTEDWSRGLEVRTDIDRDKFYPLQPIKIVTHSSNRSKN